MLDHGPTMTLSSKEGGKQVAIVNYSNQATRQVHRTGENRGDKTTFTQGKTNRPILTNVFLCYRF